MDERLEVMVTGALEGAGYMVIGAKNFVEGLRKLYESYPDVIIVDRGLPDVYGEDVCLRIRQASYLPLIALGGREDAAESLELGADAFMTKPPSLRELVARVRNLLKRKSRFGKHDDNTRLSISDEQSTTPLENGNLPDYLPATEFRLDSFLADDMNQSADSKGR